MFLQVQDVLNLNDQQKVTLSHHHLKHFQQFTFSQALLFLGVPGLPGSPRSPRCRCQEQLAPTSGIGGGGVDGHMLPGLAASAVARALREDSCEAPTVTHRVLVLSWVAGDQKTWGVEAAKMGDDIN